MAAWRDKLPSVRARERTLESLLEIALGHIADLTRHQELLDTRIAQLEERLATNSRNSSRPPSSDGPSSTLHRLDPEG